MGLFSFSKKDSSGIFIPKDGGYVELTESIENDSINGIAEYLGYEYNQFHTYMGDFDRNADIQEIVIEMFICNVLFVLTKKSVTKVDNKMVTHFLRNFDYDFEFSSYNVNEFLEDGIENNSLSLEFLSRVLGLKTATKDGIYLANKIGLYLEFKNGYLTSFTSADGLNEWARYFKNLNPEVYQAVESVARKFWKKDQDKISEEINFQFNALANIPQCFQNEYIDLHRTKFGTVNYCMLLVCHYGHGINLNDFLTINHGRFEVLNKSDDGYKMLLDKFTYEFSKDGSLLEYSLKK